jgi:hypothetical protein
MEEEKIEVKNEDLDYAEPPQVNEINLISSFYEPHIEFGVMEENLG